MNITLKVAAVINNKNNDILLIKEKYTEEQGYKWNLVKGTYDDPNETLEECVVREIKEEVGLTEITDISLNRAFHYGKKEDPKILFIFTAKYLGDEAFTTVFNNQDENIAEIKWFSQEEAAKLKKEDCMAEYVYSAVSK